MTEEKIALKTARTAELDDARRAEIVQVCVDAHKSEDFYDLFSFLPQDGLHILGYVDDQLAGHAVVTTRWLQPENHRLVQTAYVDAVSTKTEFQGRGVGSAVMRFLAKVITDTTDYEIACLETERVTFYERLGWQEWAGSLAGRDGDNLIPTPDQTGVMILRIPDTPVFSLNCLLTIEASPARIW
ncbi:MAG: GNAT family N-acetyltransferase [Chitinophagaceae bacterium]|nr:GNAT family N-acetyltransferase [Anaerolineae bacterium]